MTIEKRLATLAKRQAATRRANEREIKRIEARQKKAAQIGERRV